VLTNVGDEVKNGCTLKASTVRPRGATMSIQDSITLLALDERI